MNYEESKELDLALQTAFEEVFEREDLDDDTMDAFYDLADAIVFEGGENELDFEQGYALAEKLLNSSWAKGTPIKILKTHYCEQTFYYVGTEEEIIKKLNAFLDCNCSSALLLRNGCQCGGS